MNGGIEAMFASIDAMDVDGFLSHLSQNVVFQFGNTPALEGIGAVKEGVSAFFSGLNSLRHSLTGKWTSGDTTILRFATYYVRHDGVEVSVPCAVILRYADSLIDDYRIYTDLTPLFAPSKASAAEYA